MFNIIIWDNHDNIHQAKVIERLPYVNRLKTFKIPSKGTYVINYEKVICWYHNGELHRADGPAVEWDDGIKEYWLNGQQQ